MFILYLRLKNSGSLKESIDVFQELTELNPHDAQSKESLDELNILLNSKVGFDMYLILYYTCSDWIFFFSL